MTTFKYPWGLERPRDKRSGLDDRKRAITLQKLKLCADFWEAMRRLDVREKEIDAELSMLDFVTPNGRFSSDRAREWAAKTGSVVMNKRRPGRPPKYKPGEPRPPRKSRAKTPNGLARHALIGVKIPKKNARE